MTLRLLKSSSIFCLGAGRVSTRSGTFVCLCTLGNWVIKIGRQSKTELRKKLSGWKGEMLSVGGRLILINSVLSSLPIFMMSFFELPKEVLEKIDCFRSRFYWQNDQHKRKYRLAKWEILCQPKIQGGLGIQNLELQNKCLLSKWLFKLINEDGLWQELLRNKYIKDKSIGSCTKKPTDSHFWKRPDECQRYFYGFWVLQNQRRVANSFLDGHLVREPTTER
jgi:hypothetical protein